MAVAWSSSAPDRSKSGAFRLESLILALGAAAAIELLLLRIFTRTAIHIPALQALAGPYEAFSLAARYAYFVALVLLMLALPLAGIALWRENDLPARSAACAIAAFGAAATIARATAGPQLLADAVTVGAVAGIATAAAARTERRLGFALMGFAAAFIMTGSHTLLQTASGTGGPSYDGRLFLDGGELAAVAFALAAPWALRVHPGRRVIVAASGVSLLTFALLLRGEATTKVLLLWNEGVAGTYPSVVYALAAGTVVATLLGLYSRQTRLQGVGFALLMIGGFGLHSTYQTGLVITGMAVIMFAASGPRVSSTVPQSRTE